MLQVVSNKGVSQIIDLCIHDVLLYFSLKNLLDTKSLRFKQIEPISKNSGETWSVYILHCSNNNLYTGIAKDVEKRFTVHKKGRGARYTRIYPPLSVIYTELCDSHQVAMKREREIKGWTRKQKVKKLELTVPVILSPTDEESRQDPSLRSG